MSRLVMMGVVAVVLLLFVNAVTLYAQEGSLGQPFIGHLPSELSGPHLSSPHGTACPSPPLPFQPGGHACTYTHTSYLSCVFYFLMSRVAHWLGIFTSGRGGGQFQGRGGGKEGQGIPGEDRGVTVTLALSRNSFSLPSQGPTPAPQRGGPCLQ